jgi:hypothetical protein
VYDPDFYGSVEHLASLRAKLASAWWLHLLRSLGRIVVARLRSGKDRKTLLEMLTKLIAA